MIKRSLKETKNGWFISGFTEAIYKENFEVGVKKYKAGEKEARGKEKDQGNRDKRGKTWSFY